MSNFYNPSNELELTDEEYDSEFDDQVNPFEELKSGSNLTTSHKNIRKLEGEVKQCQLLATESCITFAQARTEIPDTFGADFKTGMEDFETIYINLALQLKQLQQERHVYGPEMEKVIDRATVQTNWMKEIRNIKDHHKGEGSSTENEIRAGIRVEFREGIRGSLSFDPWEGDQEMELEEAGDIVEVFAPQALICPITQSLFEEPVKADCDHTYEQAAILKMIHSNGGRCRCPVRGCNYMVTAEELIEDVEIKEKIRKHVQQEDAEIDLTSVR